MLKNNIVKILSIIMTMFFAGFGDILSAPALPRPLEITQPNGAKFKAYLRGDEFFSWWESEKGTVLFRNLESGYFEYAKFSMIEKKVKLVSAGVIFVAAEESSFSNARFSNKTKFNLGKIWRQKRDDARKRLQEILKKQKQSGN